MSSEAATHPVPDTFVIEDPDRDEPMAAQEHSDTIDNLHYPLRGRLPGPTCYVARDLRVYRDLSDPRAFRAPDVLVALEVPDRVRKRYVIAEEGKAPDLVIEVLSPETAEKDLEEKRDWYQGSGVREYLIADPVGEMWRQPRLQCWRFGTTGRRRDLPGDDGIVRSELVPFGWTIRNGWVRLVDLETGDVFPTMRELEPRIQLEMLARLQAERVAEAAEEAQREAELERDAAKEERDAATAGRDAATAGRDAAAARLYALQQEVERLRRQLGEGEG